MPEYFDKPANVTNHGPGLWRIVTYNPRGAVGEFEGDLSVTKDHHVITKTSRDGSKVLVCETPNPNVAICYNPRFIQNSNRNYELNSCNGTD